MFRKRFALLTTGLATVPVIAQAAPDGAVPHTLRVVEFGYDGHERMVMATAMLQSAVPVGSSLNEAKLALAEAGSAMRTRDAVTPELRSHSFESVDDVLHDVVWTVDVLRDGDRSAGLEIDRASIGS